MSKVLVTGGSGYVGSVLVPYLVNHGLEVKVLETMTFGNPITAWDRDWETLDIKIKPLILSR